MVDSSAVLGVLSVYVAGVVIPGPNFVAVAHKAASATRTEALAVVAGIVLVNLFWASCAILGVGIVFAAFPWLAFAVKVAGAAYLMWFGGRLIVKASAGKPQQNAQAPGGSVRQAFAQGFATNIANPKSVAFLPRCFRRRRRRMRASALSSRCWAWCSSWQAAGMASLRSRCRMRGSRPRTDAARHGSTACAAA